ncbi:MAG: hypothetical protein R6X34_07765 [Chloroflexota bacterium]
MSGIEKPGKSRAFFISEEVAFQYFEENEVSIGFNQKPLVELAETNFALTSLE